MLTPLGKQIRKYRLDKEIILSQMAHELDVSSAYLSSIETGKRNISSDLIEKMISFFELDKSEAEHLRDLAAQSQHTIKLPLDNASNSSRELVAAFARNFSSLTPEQVNKIKKILEK
ncbi:helix-turn-helix transcriptional regulator [Legionella pneumophila serogroup 1]|uniref:helix-turn-helix domain-containing protein n=1 Tax=Legionella pneumophila TaxID=446 RepID=UPI000770A080|nr:helix-turn-helix transcriptional regulator [Legionella pneumophila]MCZ4749681.1 helix-turn-helix transcriptional regulator [Legionella pneumophila]CZO93605.1 anaerobic benzoate catabolism transcriptional regulator [Legionella pneumophila]CZP73882.1 anaerobic benzoate catabolism transcriptional regulator [Legionella pneumophila]HAT6348752.1 helix-turn-helix transcriptional regulator [Legionella pneumophila]HAT7968989.1 helix-turn-helix domain-containing protein [Legionella pneumophila]